MCSLGDEPERGPGFSRKMSLKEGEIGGEVRFAGPRRAEVYVWVELTLVRRTLLD